MLFCGSYLSIIVRVASDTGRSEDGVNFPQKVVAAPVKFIPVGWTGELTEGSLRPAVSGNRRFMGSMGPSEIGGTGLVKISRSHGRANADEVLSHHFMVADEYGNVFGAVDYKGGDFDDLKVEEDVRGWRAHGLMTAKHLERLRRVSRLLRKNKIPSEVVYRVGELTSLPIGDEATWVDVGKWRMLMIGEIQTKLEILERNRFRGVDEEMTRRDVREKIEFLRNCEPFVVAERYVPVAVRLEDVTRARDLSEVRKLISPPLAWIKSLYKQFADKPQGYIGGLLENNGDFSLEDRLFLQKYFISWLPRQMGWYLARAHTLGLVSGSAHTQNWSLAGTLCDWDDADGPALGNDYEPTADNTFEVMTEKDLNTTAASILGLFCVVESSKTGPGMFVTNQFPSSFFGRWITGLYDDEGKETGEIWKKTESLMGPAVVAVANFFAEYIFARNRNAYDSGCAPEYDPKLLLDVRLRDVDKETFGKNVQQMVDILLREKITGLEKAR